MRPGARRCLAGLAVLGLALLAAGFVYTGCEEGWRVSDAGVAAEHSPVTPRADRGELRVLTWNIAKAGAYGSGGPGHRAEVRARLLAMAEVLRREAPDLVFLTETVAECGPGWEHQAALLAERVGLPHWVSSDNFRWGLPGLRVRAGNALLSRWPLGGGSVQDLPSSGTWLDPSGLRRVLWCEAQVDGRPLVLGCVRNESFDPALNLVQARRLVETLPRGTVLLAGDFNAEPASASMAWFAASGRFAAGCTPAPTFPADAPQRTIDHVLAPAAWECIEVRVLDTRLSDHRPVLARLRPPD